MTTYDINISCEAEGNFASNVSREEHTMIKFARVGAYVFSALLQSIVALALWHMVPARMIPPHMQQFPEWVQWAWSVNDKFLMASALYAAFVMLIFAERLRK